MCPGGYFDRRRPPSIWLSRFTAWGPSVWFIPATSGAIAVRDRETSCYSARVWKSSKAKRWSPSPRCRKREPRKLLLRSQLGAASSCRFSSPMNSEPEAVLSFAGGIQTRPSRQGVPAQRRRLSMRRRRATRAPGQGRFRQAQPTLGQGRYHTAAFGHRLRRGCRTGAGERATAEKSNENSPIPGLLAILRNATNSINPSAELQEGMSYPLRARIFADF